VWTNVLEEDELEGVLKVSNKPLILVLSVANNHTNRLFLFYTV